MSKEVWKEIPDYEGEYKASTLGRIKSMNRLVSRSDGRLQRRKGKILHPYKDRKGYLHVRLSGKMYSVHRLIYRTFIGEIPDGMHVNHIDENKENNMPSNLNLMTCKENRNWGTAIARGIEHFQKQLRKPIVVYDYSTGAVLYTFESITKASESLGIGTGTISEILNHKPVKHKCNGKEYTYYRRQRNGYGFYFLADALERQPRFATSLPPAISSNGEGGQLSHPQGENAPEGEVDPYGYYNNKTK